MNRLKQLGKDSVIYGIGGGLARGLGFLLLPVYTRIFTPGDYGNIEMFNVTSGLLSTLIVMGLDSAQSFYFTKSRKAGDGAEAEVVTAILQWRLIVGTILVLLGTALAPVLNRVFFGGEFTLQYFVVAFFGAFIGIVQRQGSEVLRLLFKAKIFVGIELAKSVLTAVIILIAVIHFELGIFGFLLGIFLASIVSAGLSLWLVRDYLRFDRWYFDRWPDLLRFGLPLLPAGLAMYVMTSTNRWFLQSLGGGATELGLFAVGMKFALGIALAVETFRKAWWPIALDAMHSPDGEKTFRQVSVLFMGLGMIGVIYMALLSPWIVAVFTAPEYKEAWRIVGIQGFQSVFFGFYLISAAGLWKTEKTKYAAYLSGIGALANVGLNSVLVPRYGGQGAAVATSISFFLWIAFTMGVSESLWRVRFPKVTLLFQIVLAVFTVRYIMSAMDSGRSVWIIAVVANLSVLLIALSIFRSVNPAMFLGRFRKE